MREIRLALLEADVNYNVVKTFIARVRERAVGAEVGRSLTPGQQVVKIVHQELIETLGKPGSLNLSGNTPHVIMLVGLQGSGKTTTAAKLARMYAKQGQHPIMAAADIYRPAAQDQLRTLGVQLGVPVVGEAGRSPLDICRAARDEAASRGLTPLILDTAGRLHIDEAMLDELKRIRAELKPHHILLVVDAMTGQDALTVAERFNAAVGIDAVVLTKMDGDSRGGAALSVRHVTGKPVKFVGVGEKLNALEPFHPERMASRILGMGDVLSLVEEARRTVDLEQAEKLARKVKSGKGFDLADLKTQMLQMKKMGGLGALMDKLPAQLGQLAQGAQMDEKLVSRRIGMIDSMTPQERGRPELIKASRKRRIAAGAGVSVQEVNRLLNEFEQMQKMMKLMSKGGGMQKMMRNLRGMFPGAH
jgi:signal recognition particle subunit SRP54